MLAQATFTGESASGWQTVSFATPVPVTANTVYVASYHTDAGYFSLTFPYFTSGYSSGPLYAFADGEVAGGNGVYIYGASAFPNQSYLSSNYWVDVVLSPSSSNTPTPPAPTATATPNLGYNLWNDSTIPAITSVNDSNPIELGVKFRSNVDGFITGLRFYKGSTNTGSHIGHLWSSTGTLLAQATFTGESASGWQTVSFATPVPVTANTVYVASYHTDAGYFSLTFPYFTSGYSSGPLYAFADGEVAGGNGVYIYGASAFPNQTYLSSNYWVDVVFTP